MIRDLCRGFGRYRRYLGRLRQNLRETQKFFRDIKGSHSHSCPSSPASDGEAQRGPAGDVTETGLQAGKEGSREEERAGEANWKVDRTPACETKPREKVESGRRAAWPGPWASAGGIQDALGGHPSGCVWGEGQSARAQLADLGARGAQRQEFQEQDPGTLFAGGSAEGLCLARASG